MNDEPEHELQIEGLQEAAGTVMQARGQEKTAKRNHYLMMRICQMKDQDEYRTGPKICQALGIGQRTFYRLTGHPDFPKIQEKYRQRSIERIETVKALSAVEANEHFQKFCLEMLKDCEEKLQKLLESEDERVVLEVIKIVREVASALHEKTPDELTAGMLNALPGSDEVQ